MQLSTSKLSLAKNKEQNIPGKEDNHVPSLIDMAVREGYDSFSDVGESRVWFAIKNLMPCRMH